jgi:hypothetical protein
MATAARKEGSEKMKTGIACSIIGFALLMTNLWIIGAFFIFVTLPWLLLGMVAYIWNAWDLSCRNLRRWRAELRSGGIGALTLDRKGRQGF